MIGSSPGRLDRWRERLDGSRSDLAILGVSSFLESTVVPIPLEVLLVPYLIARSQRAWAVATAVTVGCLLGAIVGYGIGWALTQSAGAWLVDAFGWGGELERFRELFAAHGFLAIVAIGVLPIPFQVAMLVAGSAQYPIGLFLLATLIARGIRYYGLAALAVWLGPRLMAWLRKISSDFRGFRRDRSRHDGVVS